MIVLAIDPGSVTAGFALLKQDGKKIHYLESGIMKFKSEDLFLDRVQDIFKQTLELVDRLSPDQIALESLIFVKSPTALIKLAQSRGAMLAALTQKYQNKIFEYSPNLVKSSVSGHGHADKEGIQKIITSILGVQEFKSHDESDALAIALCHLINYKSGYNNLLLEKKPRGVSRSLSSSLAHKIKENK